MSFIYLFLIGILIGTAMVIPGVSGAVIAVIFGIYDRAIYSLTNLFKNFKKNFIFLAILGLGISIGTIWFSNVIMFLYEKHQVITKFAFAGLILGGVPFLFKTVKNKKDKVNLLILAITFLFSLILLLFSEKSFNFEFNTNDSYNLLTFIKLFLTGIIYSIGKVIPGISGSFLLILIGMYEYVLSVISHPISCGLLKINYLIPFVIGLIIGVFILLKIMNYLLKNKFGLTYSIIIGFVLGAIPALFINVNFEQQIIKGVVTMFICFIFSYKLIK